MEVAKRDALSVALRIDDDVLFLVEKVVSILRR
jgi:hypothetical protein